MTFSPLKTAAFAGAICLVAGTAGAASHTRVDFTDASIWTDESSSQMLFSGDVASEVTLTPTNGVLTFTPPVPRVDAPFGPLVSTSEGAGVDDDEITFAFSPSNRQAITVNFSGPGVLVKAVHLGKLFSDTNAGQAEVASLSFSNGETEMFAGTVAFARNTTGYQFFELPSPIRTTGVTFTPLAPNDGEGRPDFALLAVDVAPVPLPASFALLLGALGGMGFLSRRSSKNLSA